MCNKYDGTASTEYSTSSAVQNRLMNRAEVCKRGRARGGQTPVRREKDAPTVEAYRERKRNNERGEEDERAGETGDSEPSGCLCPCVPAEPNWRRGSDREAGMLVDEGSSVRTGWSVRKAVCMFEKCATLQESRIAAGSEFRRTATPAPARHYNGGLNIDMVLHCVCELITS